MRYIKIIIIGALLAATPAAAQTVVPELHPYGLDPYKPSDAAILRSYGGTLVAQTPLLELRQLDPYKPSHAELLRQIGNGIPQWSHFSWYPNAPVPAPLMLPSMPPAMGAAAQPGAKPGNAVIILVPPGGQSVSPRISPPLPIPPIPRQQVPRSAPGGPVRASLTPEEAALTLKGLARTPPILNVSVDTTQETGATNAPASEP